MDYKNKVTNFFKNFVIDKYSSMSLYLDNDDHYLVESWILKKDWIELCQHFVNKSFDQDLNTMFATSFFDIHLELNKIESDSLNLLTCEFIDEFIQCVNKDDNVSFIRMQALLVKLAMKKEIDLL